MLWLLIRETQVSHSSCKDEFEGLEKLMCVLENASKFDFKLNLKNCHFLKRNYKYLVYIIEYSRTLSPYEKNVEFQKFPEP